LGLLEVLLPCAVVVLLAIGAYCMLDWRHRCIASAVALRPLTAGRPVVAYAAVALAWWTVQDVLVLGLGIAAASAALSFEPAVG
jgi:hypothetical protein